MIELHLIGYTEDGEHLVLDLDPDGEGRYQVAIDPDLLATVAQLREVRVRRGAPVDLRDPASAPVAAEREPRDDVPVASNGHRAASPAATAPLTVPPPLPPRRPASPPAVPSDRPRSGRRPAPAPRRPAGPAPTGPGAPSPETAEPATALDAELPDVEEPDAGVPAAVVDERAEHRPSALAVPHARLTPAEIQARLRAGRSVRAVAAEAGTDPAWIERWLPPIVAERDRVLAEARRRRLDVPRARALGPSVDRALAERGVPEERVSWTAARRADGRWRVSVRFEEDGRPRTATWLMAPSDERLHPASPLATELGAPAARASRHR